MKLRKTIITGVLLGAMVLNVTSCAKVKHFDEDDFLEICEDELNTDEDDMLHVTEDDVEKGYYFQYGSAVVFYMEYESEKDAKKEFNNILDGFEDSKEHKDFKGSDTVVNMKDHGYFVADGDVDDTYFYGGYYWSEDVIIAVITMQDDKGARKDVDEVIDAFGYKKP